MIADNRHSVETVIFRHRRRDGALIKFRVALIYPKAPVNVPDSPVKT